jgi:hypothetical protein
MVASPWFRTACRAVASVGLLLVALAFWGLSGTILRGLSTFALLATVIGAFLHIAGRGHRLLVVSGVVFAVVTCSPIDFTYLAVPGKLRVVPFVRGLPGPALRERARRGEVVLGGCLSSGREPRWLLVW